MLRPLHCYFWPRYFYKCTLKRSQEASKIVNILRENKGDLKRFIYFGIGVMLAKGLSIVSQILLGRNMGPELYGELTIILLLATYFSMPMVNGWGFVFVKIAARETAELKKTAALNSFCVVVLLISPIVLSFLLVFEMPLSNWFDIDKSSMIFAVAMTGFYAWWIFSKQVAQGFHAWGVYVGIELGWSLVILMGIGFSLYRLKLDLEFACIVFFVGYFVSGLLVLGTRKISSISITEIKYMPEILRQGWLLLFSGLIGVATFNIDRIMINRSLGAYDVGVYQAHFLATYGLASAVITLITTYIYPAYCKDRGGQLRSDVRMILVYQYPLVILLSVIVGATIFWLYSYPFNYSLFFSLCVFNAIQFHQQLTTWYLASIGGRANKIILVSQIVFLSVNVSLLALLIPHFGIVAGGISLLASSGVALAYLIKAEGHIVNERTV